MPGLLGYVSSSDRNGRAVLDRMLATIAHYPYCVTYASSAQGAYACSHHGLFDHSVMASSDDGRVGVVMDGWLVEWEAGKSSAARPSDAVRYCLNAYLEDGIAFVKDLNGQFNLLVWDDRSSSVFLVNDRYGLRPLQYALLGEALYFAPEGKAVLAGSQMSAKLNLRMVLNQLSLGRVWIGQETFFDDILMLPPASILHWRDGKARPTQYWDYTYRAEPNVDDDFVDHAVSTFQRAVRSSTTAPLRYGMSLSGGLDSRTVLAALSQLKGDRDVRAYTWGMSDTHDEVAIARQTAGRLGVSWQYLPLTAADFISHARHGVFLMEGLDLPVQSHGLRLYPLIRPHTDALVTGLALSVTLGGSYLSASLFGPGGAADTASSWVLQKAEVFPEAECLRLARISNAADIVDDLKREVIRICQAGQNEHPADQSDRFFLRARGWRYLFQRQSWQRLFVEDIAPTFDNNFIDCLLRIPPAWRLAHRFYQRFLERLEPSLMQIPYQQTMLPPATPVELWQEGTRLEERREQLYRTIWRATSGRVFIPYQRFFTNYDEWLRADSEWVAMTNDLLVGPTSVSCERLLNRQSVVDLIDDHRSGRAANYRKIIQLINLELVLREFFD